MENFVKGFSEKYPSVPVNLYGKLCDSVFKPDPSPPTTVQLPSRPEPTSVKMPNTTTASRTTPTPKSSTTTPPTTGQGTASALPPLSNEQKLIPKQSKPAVDRPKIKIALKRNGGNDWSLNNDNTQDLDLQTSQHQVRTSVAENVSSFINGIRASFRNENVIVVSKLQSKKSAEDTTRHETS